MLPELKNTEMEIAEGLIACEAPDCEAFEVETLGATLGAIFKGGPQHRTLIEKLTRDEG